MPLTFSIITPSFNQGMFIEQTIQSVLRQAYAGVEHIVIDGGSSDGTLGTLEKYPHLKWVSEKDRGQSDALNKGFRMSRGDIVGWINSDDWYEPGVLGEIAKWFEDHPDGNVVMGNCNLVNADGAVVETVVNAERGFEELQRFWVPRSIPTQPAVFFRRCLLDEFGYLDESLHLAMDYDLWMRFAGRNRFYHLDRTVANYRFHPAAKGGDQDWGKFVPEWKLVRERYLPRGESPRVSVVIPCYNYGRFLEQSVGSVLGQTYRNFEILIVDDGSTDDTRAVAERMISANPAVDIRLIRQENSGKPALARNRGIREGGGEFILCLDADDLILPRMLERCVELLVHDPAVSIAYTDQVYFGEGEPRIVRVSEYDFRLLAGGNFMGYCSMYRRRVWEDVGGYPADVGYEDWDFWISCGERGFFGKRIPEPLFCYRQHGGGQYEKDRSQDSRIKARIMRKHPSLYGEETPMTMGKSPCVDGRRGIEAVRQCRVVAIVSAHNEGDVIRHVIGDLILQGVSVYLIDHRSSDNTVEEASKCLGKGLLHIEHFPEDSGYPEENNRQYIWRHILARKEELASQLDAEWFIHHDADEFRESPWPGLTLAEAIRVVDRLGYSAIDFELLNFRPTDDSFVRGTDVRESLRYYEGGKAFDARQIKAWKNPGKRVSIAASGGHDISFEGRRVFPVKFLLRHYPIRGQAHGERKVFRDRKARFNAEERAAGWHVQYDAVESPRHNFLRGKGELTLYDGDAVRLRLLSAEALRIAEEWRRDPPLSREEAPASRGRRLKREKRHEEARRVFEDVLAAGDGSVLVDLGDIEAVLGRMEAAESRYRQALRQDPRDGKALGGLGLLDVARERPAAAERYFERALAIDPRDAASLCGMGLSCKGRGVPEKALAWFSRALDVDPVNVTALHELTIAAHELGRLEEAERYLSGYIQYSPSDPHILFSLAGVLFRLGKRNAALEAVEKLEFFAPSYDGARSLKERIIGGMEEACGIGG